MLSGADTQQPETVTQHLTRGIDQVEARIAQRRVVDDKGVRVVIGVEVVRQLAQVIGQHMRFMRERRAFDHLRVARQRRHHGLLVGLIQAVEAGCRARGRA